MSNKSRGFSFERRRLKKIREQGGYGFRAFGSKGIVDLVYVDAEGTAHLEQLKFSSNGDPRITRQELEALKTFAARWRDTPCEISLVLKRAYREAEVIKLNV